MDGKAQRSVIFCNGIVGLVEHIIDQCDHPPDECMIKVGIDGGGGFLKVCMNILNSQNEQTKNYFSYSRGAFSQAFYDSGVKKLMILAIAEFVKETYESLKQILELLCLESVVFTLAVDMKLANVFLGLGSAALTYPCPWCETSKNDFGNQAMSGKLRTLGIIRFNSINHQKALNVHLKKSKLLAASYKSCVNLPLLNLPDETKVLNGNQCRHLLKNVYLLKELFENTKIEFEGGKLIAAFKTFNTDCIKCFKCSNKLSTFKSNFGIFKQFFCLIKLSD